MAAVRVAVPTPERIYPPQTKISAFIFPAIVVPKTAYPLLVNALETITKESKG